MRTGTAPRRRFIAAALLVGLAAMLAPSAATAAVPANTALPQISGTTTDGQTVTATNGTWSGSPTSYSRQWRRCDGAGASCTNISGATATTYTLAAADVGKTIRVAVTATNSSGSASATSAQTGAVAPRPPANTAAPTITGTAKDGQTLTSTTGTWTGTAPITYSRQWRRCDAAGANCASISGATGTTYGVTSADVGSRLSVAITATNAASTATANSTTTAVVTALAPVKTVSPAITGTAKEGQLLTGSSGTWTGSTPMTFAYQWQSCTSSCTNISGATATVYRLVAAQVGKTIKVQVTATNAAGSASATSAATASVTTGPPMNVTAPSITGTTTDGQVLTLSTGTWTGTATISYARQWKRCNAVGAACTNIVGATAGTYTLTAADIGSTIKASVTGINAPGSATQESAITNPIAGLPPANTTAPTVTGTFTDGQTLSSTTGTWSGSTPISYTRQWHRCDEQGEQCVSIAGATQNTYALGAEDVGATFTVSVVATNMAASTGATSVATPVIAGVAPTASAAPSISGIARDGETLTASNGTWSGTVPIELTNQWQRCDGSGANCVDIEEETTSAYTATTDDLDKTLRVSVTATNGAGETTVASPVTAAIVTSPPMQRSPARIGGIAQVGHIVTADPGDWTGTDDITYSFEWQRCDASGSSCSAITGGPNSSNYSPTDDDIGSTLRAHITIANAYGTPSVTSPVSEVVAARAPVLPSTIEGVPEPLDPTAPANIADTAAFINAVAPEGATDAPCDATCTRVAQAYQTLLASLPDEDAFGVSRSGSELNRLIDPTAVKDGIAKRIGDAIINSGLARTPMIVRASVIGGLVGANIVVWGRVYQELRGPRVMRTEFPAGPPTDNFCAPPPLTRSCPITHEHLQAGLQGSTVLGTTMPADGYLYEYTVAESPVLFNVASCPNWVGVPTLYPTGAALFSTPGSVACQDGVSTGGVSLAVVPFSGVSSTVLPYTGQETVPDTIVGEDPRWTGPPPFDDTLGPIGSTLEDDDVTKDWIASAIAGSCNADPASETVTIPTIKEGQSGQSYANCLATLGIVPTVVEVPFTEADTSLPPGAVINVTPGPDTTISPEGLVTITTNPGGGSGPQAALLEAVEQGLIAHNPDLVNGDPDFEDETVPLVAQQCLKLVKKAQAAGPGAGGAVADESDCGSTTSRGLPMFVLGREAEHPALNDLAGLKRNPSWVMLNARISKDLPGRQWYRNKKEPAPGCPNATKPADHSCDEYPYWATLQAKGGSLQSLVPSIQWTPKDENTFEGNALQQFYSNRNPGDSMWFHGCDVFKQPPTDVAPLPESTFLVLPLPLLRTTGICNRPTP